jgi:hypothetical protein
VSDALVFVVSARAKGTPVIEDLNLSLNMFKSDQVQQSNLHFVLDQDSIRHEQFVSDALVFVSSAGAKGTPVKTSLASERC